MDGQHVLPALALWLGVACPALAADIANPCLAHEATIVERPRYLRSRRERHRSALPWSSARRTDAVGRAEDIARNHPALLILHGTDDAMLSSQSVVALRDALAPYYRSAGNERRLRLMLVEGLAHGWADSAHADDLRRSIAQWFRMSG